MRPVRTLSRLTTAVAAAAVLAVFPSPAMAQTKPFDPVFEVNPAHPSADEAVQIQIVFELAEGNSFLKSASFRIPAEYQVTNSDEMPNGDIIGDGTLRLKVGSLGEQTPALCLSNKSPNTPGAYSTINVAVQIGTSEPGSCSGLLNLTFTMKRFDDGKYGFDFTLPRDVVGQQLDTPVQLIINLHSVTKPNKEVNPPTSGGVPVVKNPAQPGNYQWTLSVEDIEGRKKDLVAPVRVDESRRPTEKSSGLKISPIAMVGGIAIGVVIVAAAILLLRRRPQGAAVAGTPSETDHFDPGYEHFYEELPDYEGSRTPADDATGGPEAPRSGYDPTAVDHGGETADS